MKLSYHIGVPSILGVLDFSRDGNRAYGALRLKRTTVMRFLWVGRYVKD